MEKDKLRKLKKTLSQPKYKEPDKFSLRLSDSRGSKKIKHFFLELLDKEDFQAAVKQFRKDYGIPESGFSLSDEHVQFKGKHLAPDKWSYPQEGGDNAMEIYSADKEKLCKKFKIPVGAGDLFSHYIVYNAINPLGMVYGLCETQDCYQIGEFKELDEEVTRHYPVAIRLSPYASINDILDYVKVAYTKEVKPLQEKYKDKKTRLGRAKTKNVSVQQLNTFIYKHGHLSLNTIKDLLKEKNWFGKERLGQSEISKILSSERERREKV